jgi:pyridoxamine 5'-phosphate oxidase
MTVAESFPPRRDYDGPALLESTAAKDPFEQFGRWFDDVLAAGFIEPWAMVLATVSPEGQPSARMVLLKEWDRSGFVFYTNTESRKGRELAANPRASLLFWWDRLHRQVRIEGSVERVPDAMADAYFATRPYGSQIGAWASRQSASIPDRAWLEARAAEFRQRYPQDVPRPPHWGGYRVVPHAFEFWQGRPDRLHDRLFYERVDGVWRRSRLAP